MNSFRNARARAAARSGVAAMAVAAIDMVVCIVLIKAFGAPQLPTLIVGGFIIWIAMAVIMIKIGLGARRSKD